MPPRRSTRNENSPITFAPVSGCPWRLAECALAGGSLPRRRRAPLLTCDRPGALHRSLSRGRLPLEDHLGSYHALCLIPYPAHFTAYDLVQAGWLAASLASAAIDEALDLVGSLYCDLFKCRVEDSGVVCHRGDAGRLGMFERKEVVMERMRLTVSLLR